jgi:uncharacterized protein
MKKVIYKLKKHFHEVISIKKTPKAIAQGFALGTFLAILPTFGLGILIGLLLILIFSKISKVSMFIAFAIWNPIVLAPIAFLSYSLGDLILGEIPVVEYELTMLQQFFVISRRFLLGNLIIATIASIFSYFIAYFISRKYQQK